MNKLDTLLSAFKAHCHKKGNKLWFSPTPTDIAADVRLAGIPNAWDTFSGVVRRYVSDWGEENLGWVLFSKASALIGGIREHVGDRVFQGVPLLACMHWLALADPQARLIDDVAIELEGLHVTSWNDISTLLFRYLVVEVADEFIVWLDAGLKLEKDLKRNRWGTDNYRFHPATMRSKPNAT